MSIHLIKEKNAVQVPLTEWEKTQKELIRLRKQVKETKTLAEIKNAVVSFERDLRKGKKSNGKDARSFVSELMNEK